MESNLLFITSHYFHPLTLQALDRIHPDCHTTVVAYDDFSQIPEIYLQHRDTCDGIFVSGVSAKRILEIHCPDISVPITAFQVDSDGLHRDILRFSLESPGLDFSRVAMDFLLPLGQGYSVKDFLKMEDIDPVFQENQSWVQDPTVRSCGAETLILSRIVRLWEQKAIDSVICMYSSNIPKLQEQGIPCRCPFMSDSQLARLIREVLVRIELQHLHDNHPALVQIFPSDSNFLSPEQTETLERETRAFLRNNLIDAVVQCSDTCCSILTSLQIVRFLTEEFRCCRLQTLFQEKLPFPVNCGYGIGPTVSHAMNNVQIASREAKLQGSPFAVDSNGNLLGPLVSGFSGVLTQSVRMQVSEISRTASLSVMTIQKLLMVLHNRGTDKITIQELAESLATTTRNANRIMLNLLKSGLATPVYTKTSHSRGRPVQVFALDLRIRP